ncbi:MAG: hypothetical protein GY828_00060 [Candidatus Gracilibacteria bacterium]|nr:hypothetical protein [Candidatus Gracilibacteria bacterium]
MDKNGGGEKFDHIFQEPKITEVVSEGLMVGIKKQIQRALNTEENTVDNLKDFQNGFFQGDDREKNSDYIRYLYTLSLIKTGFKGKVPQKYVVDESHIRACLSVGLTEVIDEIDRVCEIDNEQVSQTNNRRFSNALYNVGYIKPIDNQFKRRMQEYKRIFCILEYLHTNSYDVTFDSLELLIESTEDLYILDNLTILESIRVFFQYTPENSEKYDMKKVYHILYKLYVENGGKEDLIQGGRFLYEEENKILMGN